MTAFFGRLNGRSCGSKVPIVLQGTLGSPQTARCLAGPRRFCADTRIVKKFSTARNRIVSAKALCGSLDLIMLLLANFRSARLSVCDSLVFQPSIRDLKFHGGEGGIRTHGTVPRSQHFQCCQFNHSCTSPREEFRISDCELRNSKNQPLRSQKRLSSKTNPQSEFRNPKSSHPLMPRRQTISLYWWSNLSGDPSTIQPEEVPTQLLSIPVNGFLSRTRRINSFAAFKKSSQLET